MKKLKKYTGCCSSFYVQLAMIRMMETLRVFDTQPAATYLSSRSEDFSEWIHIMKYADLYNAVNQATQRFTLFVPNNTAVQEFYTRRGVSSIEELGTEYARNLVSYHYYTRYHQSSNFY